MEALLCKSLIWKVGLSSKEDYNDLLDALFLSSKSDDLLLELQYLSFDCDASYSRLLQYFVHEANQLSVERFGQALTQNLKTIYQTNAFSIVAFSTKCNELWNLLPDDLKHTEPFYTLCYANDPLLDWDDEAQTRHLLEKFFDFYIERDAMISIIVPVYNIAPYLSRCLDSILAQTHENLEIIVVNDGSTDDSAKIINEYAKKDTRIVPLHKQNGGVSAARRDGILASSGEYIGFVDGDDVIDPDMYERLLHNLLAHDADISHCGHQVHEMDAREIEYFGNDGVLLAQPAQNARELLINGDFQPGLWNKLYKRELVIGVITEECMDLTIRMHEDLLMNFYLFGKASQTVYEGFCPYHYIKREGSATTCKPVLWKYRDPVRVNEIMLETTLETDLEKITRKALLSQYVHMYGKLLSIKGEEFQEFAKELRNKIKANRQDRKLLSRKQQISASFILYAPPLFRLLYALYH